MDHLSILLPGCGSPWTNPETKIWCAKDLVSFSAISAKDSPISIILSVSVALHPSIHSLVSTLYSKHFNSNSNESTKVLHEPIHHHHTHFHTVTEDLSIFRQDFNDASILLDNHNSQQYNISDFLDSTLTTLRRTLGRTAVSIDEVYNVHVATRCLLFTPMQSQQKWRPARIEYS